jgi:hypothetical protein
MPLPKSINTESNRTAIKRDFNDLDSLLDELNVQKEVIANGSPGADPGRLFNPEPLADPVEAMPAEVAALSGKTIANTIDTALGTGMMLYAKSTNPEKYQATDKQIRNLEQAWAAVAAKYNYRVEDSPWLNVGVLSVATYLPHFQEAKNDRRFAMMDERIRQEKAEREALAARLDKIEKEQNPVA